MTLLRKRNTTHKIFLPATARDNQYIIGTIPLNEDVLSSLSNLCHFSEQNYRELYDLMSTTLFDLAEQFELKSVLFIGNDKLPRVRYSPEVHQWQTNQQLLCFYNPQYHELKRSFYDSNRLANKINILFLSSGDNIRYNAAQFHQHVVQLLSAFCDKMHLDKSLCRIRDHQHLTYDLFAKEKGIANTQEHALRPIDVRYQQQMVTIPELNSALTYAVVNLTVTDRLIAQAASEQEKDFTAFYNYIADAFTTSAKQCRIDNAAIIANGLVPIVRNSSEESIASEGELQYLGYNPASNQGGIICKWNTAELVDTIQFVFIATNYYKSDHGYGRFLNQLEKMLRLLSDKLMLIPQKDDLITRFHQHIAYNLESR